MAPPFGTLDVAHAAANAPFVTRFADDIEELHEIRLMQLITEMSTAGQRSTLPPALHPTSPPTVIWQVLDVAASNLGAFRLAMVKVGARAVTKSRGFLVHAFAQGPGTTLDRLRDQWAIPCLEAEIEFDVGHHRASSTVRIDGDDVLRMAIVDPHPIASSTVYYAPSMNLARTAAGPRLAQFDPEYLIKSVSRGVPEVFVTHPAIDELVRPTWPVSGTLATVDCMLPAIRFLTDPTRPAVEGTESVEASGTEATPRVRYLSQEWLDMTTEQMKVLPPVEGATLVMQCVMTDAPGGDDIVFHRVFRDGRLLESKLGAHESPDVVLFSTYHDSVLHVRGDLPENEAFATGKIRPQGNTELLRRLRPMTMSDGYLGVIATISELTAFD